MLSRNKFRIFLFISITVLVVGIVIFFKFHRGSSTNASALATNTVFQWQAAGITFNYPTGWYLPTWEPSDLQDSSRIELLSPSGANGAGYFCIELDLDSVSSTLNSNYYKLTGGNVIGSVLNGLELYQQEYKDSSTKDILRTYITDNNQFSEIQLLNGKELFANISYSCAGDSVDATTLTYNQQQESPDYQTALKTFESFQYAQQP